VADQFARRLVLRRRLREGHHCADPAVGQGLRRVTAAIPGSAASRRLNASAAARSPSDTHDHGSVEPRTEALGEQVVGLARGLGRIVGPRIAKRSRAAGRARGGRGRPT
jgi:hypothetical protein